MALISTGEKCIKPRSGDHLAERAVLLGIASVVHDIGHRGAELLLLPDVRQHRIGIAP